MVVRILIDCAFEGPETDTYRLLNRLVSLFEQRPGVEVFQIPDVSKGLLARTPDEGNSLWRLSGIFSALPVFPDENGESVPAAMETGCDELCRALSENQFSALLVWGSSLTRSRLLIETAERLGSPYFVLERGVVPRSLAVFHKAQWNTPLRQGKKREPVFSEIRFQIGVRISKRQLLRRLGWERRIDLKPAGSVRDTPGAVIYLGGFTFGSGNNHLEQVHSLQIARETEEVARREGNHFFVQNHPADKVLPPQEFVELASALPDLKTARSKRLAVHSAVTHETNLWVLGPLAEFQVKSYCSASLNMSSRLLLGDHNGRYRTHLLQETDGQPTTPTKGHLRVLLSTQYFGGMAVFFGSGIKTLAKDVLIGALGALPERA